jgi:hypothetical protein
MKEQSQSAELNIAPDRATDLEYSYSTVTLKQQGNGTDSWVINYFNEKDERIFSEIVYKDPAKKDIEQAEKVVETITVELLISLWDKMIESLTNEQIEVLKNKLK